MKASDITKNKKDIKLSKIELENFVLKEVVSILKKRNKTISTAESLTAGLVSSLFANISGSSQVLKGGIIAYDIKIKETILKIDKNILKEDAINKETAIEMAKKVAILYDSDYGISITGIAEKFDKRNQLAYMSIYDKEFNRNFNIYIEYEEECERNICRLEMAKLLINNLYMYLDS